MKFWTSIFVCSLCMVFFPSCDCDCPEAGDYVKIRLVRNGENAITGSSPIVHPDSIQFYSQYFPASIENIDFQPDTSYFSLYLKYGGPYCLKLGNIRTDTLQGRLIQTNDRKCCPEYAHEKVWRNNFPICEDNCSEIIEIEI